MQTSLARTGLLLSTVLLILGSAFARFYQIVIDDEFPPCKGHEDKPMSKFLDLSEVDYARGPTGELIMEGEMKYTSEIKPDSVISFKVDCKYNDRGSMLSAPFVFYLEDFCAAEFDPKRDWFNLTSQFSTPEERTCPPATGQQFSIRNVNILPVFEVPTRMKEGEYACDVKMEVDRKEIVTCFVCKGDVKAASV